MKIVLTSTHHDPDRRLVAQSERVLPALRRIFPAIAVLASQTTPPDALAPLEAAGVLVRLVPPQGLVLLGRTRRDALAVGLEAGAEWLFFCDLDRILHWAEFYPDELSQTAAAITGVDLTVLGRTPRAFASHPRTQRDTEAIINSVFAATFGAPWDITAAARGLSRRAAKAILAGCQEETIGTDGAWPLFAHTAGLSLAYRETEGLEFETPDRFPHEIAAAGGIDRWLAQLDASASEWAARVAIAKVEVEAVLRYSRPKTS